MRRIISRAAWLALAGVAVVPGAASAQTTIPVIVVTASRLWNGIPGTSTTVITANDIERSPGQTVQDVLATIPGVQLQSLYGGTGGAGTNVDLRGFGAFATANTLVLINGRRINDLDIAGVDLATIPRHAIARIEVTRGNSGAVLYGDNAVGGVINIVTKSGVGQPPSFRAEGGLGSFNQVEGNVSATTNLGPFSAAIFANGISSDSYRVNNHLGQANIVGDINYRTGNFGAFLNLSADDQRLGLPGVRKVEPPNSINELVTNRQGATTPFDHAEKQGLNATTGFTMTLWNGAELIVDGGVRDKRQQASYFGGLPLDPSSANYVNTVLQTWSFTPRLNITGSMFGLNSNIRTGIDYYDADYHSERKWFETTVPPSHVYDLRQRSVAGYWQQTIGIMANTDLSYGGRLQRTSLDAKDRFDPAGLPPFFTGAQSFALKQSETQHALHIGVEHRFNDSFAVFARAARAFRTPNVDERVVTGVAFDPMTFAPIPQNFQLKTQTSRDMEAGFRVRSGPLAFQASAYDMHLKNEIHFDPKPTAFFNYNLDPTHRYGIEASATYIVNESLRLIGSAAYTRAVFEEGPFAGNDVPLVSRYTGTFGFSWNVWQKYLVMDAIVRASGDRRFDNDQANFQPRMPDNMTVDLKLSGAFDRMFWSFAVNNVFDADYFDYAVASANPARIGFFNAYPLPGRTFVAKAGVTF